MDAIEKESDLDRFLKDCSMLTEEPVSEDFISFLRDENADYNLYVKVLKAVEKYKIRDQINEIQFNEGFL